MASSLINIICFLAERLYQGWVPLLMATASLVPAAGRAAKIGAICGSYINSYSSSMWLTTYVLRVRSSAR